MAAIQKFEDIQAWQEARLLTKEIYSWTNYGSVSKDLRFRDQIRSAAVSVMSNIAEGFERGGDGEFKQFLFISKGSIGEVRSLLYVALDAGYLNDDVFVKFKNKTQLIAQKLSAFINYLNSSKLKGEKFKGNNRIN